MSTGLVKSGSSRLHKDYRSYEQLLLGPIQIEDQSLEYLERDRSFESRNLRLNNYRFKDVNLIDCIDLNLAYDIWS